MTSIISGKIAVSDWSTYTFTKKRIIYWREWLKKGLKMQYLKESIIWILQHFYLLEHIYIFIRAIYNRLVSRMYRGFTHCHRNNYIKTYINLESSSYLKHNQNLLIFYRLFCSKWAITFPKSFQGQKAVAIPYIKVIDCYLIYLSFSVSLHVYLKIHWS